MFQDKMGRNLSFSEASLKILNRIYNYFLDFELMLLRWVGHIPLHGMRGFFYRLAGVKIGKGSTIHMWANFFEPKNITIAPTTMLNVLPIFY